MAKSNKPAAGGDKPPVTPKAPAADAAGATQSGTVTGGAAAGAALSTAEPQTSSAEVAQSEAPGGAQSSGADACYAALDGLDAAFDALRPAWLAVLEAARGATATDRQVLRDLVRRFINEAGAFQGGLEDDILAFLGGDDDDQDLVEIEARSRDGKPFRRAGLEWTGDFRKVHVPIDVAERLAADPNLLVKDMLVKEEADG